VTGSWAVPWRLSRRGLPISKAFEGGLQAPTATAAVWCWTSGWGAWSSPQYSSQAPMDHRPVHWRSQLRAAHRGQSHRDHYHPETGRQSAASEAEHNGHGCRPQPR
jgi:hypothetical protein